MPDFPPRLAHADDFDKALEAIQERREEVQQAAGLLEAGKASADVLALHQSRIGALDELKRIVQRHRTQQSRRAEIAQALDQQASLREAFETEEAADGGPVALSLLDELRSEQAVLTRDRNAAKVLLDRIARQIKTAEADLAATQTARREARIDQEKAAKAKDPAAAAEFELARLEEISSTYHLKALRTQQEIAGSELELIDSRLELVDRKIQQAEPHVQFSAEALAETLKEIETHRTGLEQELARLRRERNIQESRLYDARSALHQAHGEDGERSVLADQVAAKEAQMEAASRGIEYAEKQLEYDSLRQRLWEQRHQVMAGGGDVDAEAWFEQTRETLVSLEQERDIVEARLNALRKAQLELQNRLAHLEQLNGHEPAVRERLEALEQQESRGREMLAIIARVESVAERLERQLVEETKVRDWTQVWEQAAGSVAEIWGRELFVMKDEIEVDGAVVTEERGFTVGRTVIGMAAFAGVFLMGWMIRAMLRRCVLPRLTGDAQHPRDLPRDIVVAIIRNTSTFFLLVIALWIASRTLPWRGVLHGVLGGALTVAIWCQIGLWGNAVLGRVLQRNRLRREEADPASLTAYGLLGFFGRVAIWAIVALTILWALDYQIAPLIGALGVSGIAVAFALQSILADIFNSMAIILDKPFRVSDFIIVGDTLGTVEQIGIKTTRIRSLTGEQIIMTNSDLLGSRIRNFKRMLERRVAFKFGVVYQTTPEKLEQIPSMLKAIIQGVQRTRFDRAHFFEYGDFSLNFEVVYYVSGSDYTVYMDIQQAINLAMFRQFAAAGIEFAYPTQSIMVQRSAPAPRELQAAPVPYPG